MGTRILALIAVAFVSGQVYAEQKGVRGYDDTKHEIAISTGAGTNTQIVSAFTKLTEVLFEATTSAVFTGGTLVGHTSYDNETETIPISVEYFYHFDKSVSVGGIFCLNGTKYDMFGNLQNKADGTTKKTNVGEGSKTNITLMPAFKFDWLRTQHFGMYSKIGIGATLMLEKETIKYEDKDDKLHDKSKFMFNWQASLLGLEAGIPNFRAFVELGCGEQGIVLAGLRCKF
jgi:hypothetical protein